MKNMRKHWTMAALSIAFGAVAMMPGIANADVTVTRVTHFNGVMGMGASDTTTREYIKGDMKREDSTFKFTGNILSKIVGSHASTSIYRVNKNQIIKLDTGNHTYKILPMTVANAQAASSPQQNQGGQNGGAGSASQNEHKTRIIRNDLSVKATGKSRTIHGYHCKEYLIKWVVIAEDTQTKERSKNVMTSDIWATPKTSALRTLITDEAAYKRAYLKRLGVNLSPQEQHQFGMSMLGFMSGSNQKKLSHALSQIHGYPISTSVKWESDAKNGESGESGSQESGQEALQQAASNLGGMLGGMFHHQEEKPKQKPAESGMHTIFSSSTEIVNVKAGTVSASVFEVPAGYRKVSAN